MGRWLSLSLSLSLSLLAGEKNFIFEVNHLIVTSNSVLMLWFDCIEGRTSSLRNEEKQKEKPLVWALTYIHTYICMSTTKFKVFIWCGPWHTYIYIYIYVYLQLNVKFLFGSPGLAPDVIFAGSLSLNVFSLFCLSWGFKFSNVIWICSLISEF